ncbi:MAG: nucleoside triphosphate pyrophosphohydrolase [Candidatus Pacebacteria bacterium]|nr:nucleoside triphosphate pyrophosphohydrolase [Candidatus Paceibacterota bacterium]
MRKEFGKLVRDRIPEIIESKGEKVFIKTLEREEYVGALKEKLIEEAKEVQGTKDRPEVLEELADLLEVAMALMQVHRISFMEVEGVRRKKRQEKGGFDKKIYLEATE